MAEATERDDEEEERINNKRCGEGWNDGRQIDSPTLGLHSDRQKPTIFTTIQRHHSR